MQRLLVRQTRSICYSLARNSFRSSVPVQAAMSSSAKQYKLSEKAYLWLDKGDLTQSRVDAIVNAANERLLGGGGVDGGGHPVFGLVRRLQVLEGQERTFCVVYSKKASKYRLLRIAIHRAAGPELLEACREIPEVEPGIRCPTGEAQITKGFELPAKYVIHTVGPVYSSKDESEPLLYNAYKNSLELANEQALKSVAFPAISCGVFGYPVADAATVSLQACKEHVGNLEEIVFILFGNETYSAYTSAADELLKSSA